MSIQAVSWVLDHSKSSGNDRCVLIAVANRFDAQHPDRCYPSIETIAKEANVSKSTALRCVASLVDMGELVRHKHAGPRPNGARRELNLYVIPALSEWSPKGCQSDTLSDSKGVKSGALRVSTVTPDSSVEPSVKEIHHSDVPLSLVQETLDTEEHATNEAIIEAFETWWDGWPRKVSKGAGRRAFRKALTKTDIDTLTTARDAYARFVRSRPDGMKFCKHPATWLNDECWEDENSEPSPFDDGDQIIY